MPLVSGLLGASGASRAGNAVNNTAIAAEHGVIGAAANGQQDVTKALLANEGNVTDAGKNAIQTVNDATGSANTTLADALSKIQGATGNIYSDLQPNIDAGKQGVTSLANYAASNPQFNFDPSKYLNSDAMKFDIQQGSDAIQNSAAARGLGVSGNTLKDLTSFSQGTAAKYYDQAFNEAQSQFQTNQNTTLANLSALIGQGLTATGQANSANTSLNNLTAGLSSEQAQNTLGAGYYGGNTSTSLAQFLANQNLQGNEFNSNTGMQGAVDAGKFALTGAEANAQGILGSTNSLANLFGPMSSNLWNVIGPMVGLG